MNRAVHTYEGDCLVAYPTATVDAFDVKLEVPSQYYTEEALTGLIKFLKKIRKQHRQFKAGELDE